MLVSKQLQTLFTLESKFCRTLEQRVMQTLASSVYGVVDETNKFTWTAKVLWRKTVDTATL